MFLDEAGETADPTPAPISASSDIDGTVVTDTDGEPRVAELVTLLRRSFVAKFSVTCEGLLTTEPGKELVSTTFHTPDTNNVVRYYVM